MSPKNIAIGGVILAALPLLGILFWQIDPLPASAGADSDQRGTVGDSRANTLKEITRLYVSRDDNVSLEMKSGTGLAPPAFLNEQLQLRGTKWRVRETDGLKSDTYDVS